MTEETENMTEETENIDELAKYRPTKEELEAIMKEEAEKEEIKIKRLTRKAELREKEKKTGITILPEEEVEKAEKPPKRKVAGTIFDKRFPPLEESAGYCTEHGKELPHRFNKETRTWETYVDETKIKEKPAERFRG